MLVYLKRTELQKHIINGLKKGNIIYKKEV